ncbi:MULTISPECIES: hypothetical protein [unclassified Moorena]|uniref:hypothetical protein n=1 Tax=unclassified Moorena TaxID=2683338 RepID=UPI0014000640|nr:MULTISPECIES: hypothetical protein [unclassified Moorena]NEO16547.1 hypothetical protein [Moorena sp. SIO3E8]NEQ03077.1 hypothetical protein [Moorena sp. SIO3F7]
MVSFQLSVISYQLSAISYQFDPVVRYGTDYPNTGYRKNEGSPVPNAPYYAVRPGMLFILCEYSKWQILLFNAINARVVKGFFPYKESQ